MFAMTIEMHIDWYEVCNECTLDFVRDFSTHNTAKHHQRA